jgi:hypothetical protein
MIEWDEAKRRLNRDKHGVDLAEIEGFDWEAAHVIPDERRDYGEPCWIALGLIGARVHVAIFAQRQSGRRLISLRKANLREARKWLAQRH